MRRTAATALVLITVLATSARSIPDGGPALASRPGTGTFLFLSDLHFDPYADASIMRKLGAEPVGDCKSRASTSVSTLGSDSNYLLLKSALDNAAATAAMNHLHYDYVILTGDFLAHQFDERFQQCVGGGNLAYQQFVINTVKFVDSMIAKALPGVPVFATLGNNDSDKGDYARPSTAFLASVAQDWSSAWGRISPANRQSAVTSFERIGSYTVPNPAVPSNELVSLNTNLWVARNADACGFADPDPGGQFAWLGEVLARIKHEQRTATLVMHVLPGMDALRSSMGAPQSLWNVSCTQKFLAQMSDYRGVVREIYAGHIHRDDFRILPDRDGKPLLPIHINPSVSAVYFNNPAVEIGWYDKRSGELADYAALNLDIANGKTAWATEYVFSRAYGFSRPDLASLVDLSHKIRDGNPQSGVGLKYANYYNAGIGIFLTAANWRNYLCTQTEILPPQFVRCKAGADSHKP